MISSPEDFEIIRYIDSLPQEDLILYSKKYYVTDLKHYMKLQLEWMKEEKYFVGIRLHHDPSTEEVLEFWVEHHNPERFRAFYVLKFPKKVEKND